MSHYILFMLASFMLAIIPGPSVCFTIAYRIQNSSLNTLVSIAGQISANVIYIFAACVGLNFLLQAEPLYFNLIKFAGAGYVVYLGIKLIKSSGTFLNYTVSQDNKTLKKDFLNGFIICLSNPKIIVFYSSFLPLFIDRKDDVIFQIILLSILSVLTGIASLLLYMTIAGTAKKYFSSDTQLKKLNIISGLLMISAGVWLGVF